MRTDFNLYATFHRLLDTPLKQGILASAIIVSATLLPFLLVPYEDFRYCDETYQAYCCAHYERAYLGMLSFYIGNIWMKLFGETLIALRVLMTLCYIASVAIGCLYLRLKGISPLKTSLVYLIGTLGVILSYLPLYGWDAGAYPFTALGIISTLLYLEKPSWKRAAAIGLSAGLMMLSRIPLVAFIPFYILIIFIKKKKADGAPRNSGWVRDAVVALAATALAILGLTTLMAGSPAEYLAAVRPENTVAAHSAGDIGWIMTRCVEHAYATYDMLLPGCAALLLACYFAKTERASIPLMIFSAMVVYYMLRGAVWNQDSMRGFFWSNSGIIIPAAFITVFFGPLRAMAYPFAARTEHKDGTAHAGTGIAPSLVLVFFALLQAFGSNSPVERVGWGLAMVFGFGVFRKEFQSVSKFTFYFLSFTALTVSGFFVLKARTLSHIYGNPIELSYATSYNGTRPFGNEYYIVESVDSIKFVADNAERMGLGNIVVGRDLNGYNFGFGEKGVNAGIRFDVYTEDLYRDYLGQNKNNAADIVVCLNINRDSLFEARLATDGYLPYQNTFYPFLSIWAKDSVIGRLPADPFKEWGYRPRRDARRDG